MAGRLLSGPSLEATPHMELGMHLCFGFMRASSTLSGQVEYISVLYARSCARVGNRGKSLSRSHSSYTSSSAKPSKRFLSTQAGGSGGPCGRLTFLGACHSGEGGLLTRLGLGLGLCLGGLNQGPRSVKVTVRHCRLTAPPCHGSNFA